MKNLHLLEKVADSIVKEREHYDHEYYINNQNFYEIEKNGCKYLEYNMTEHFNENGTPYCETTMCLAGWVVHHYILEHMQNNHIKNYYLS